MAVSTKRYEIIFLVASDLTSKLNVMYLKILQAAALLTAPVVSL
jgi:hypothetical protein